MLGTGDPLVQKVCDTCRGRASGSKFPVISILIPVHLREAKEILCDRTDTIITVKVFVSMIRCGVHLVTYESPYGGRQNLGTRPPVISEMICKVYPSSPTTSALVSPVIYLHTHEISKVVWASLSGRTDGSRYGRRGHPRSDKQ